MKTTTKATGSILSRFNLNQVRLCPDVERDANRLEFEYLSQDRRTKTRVVIKRESHVWDVRLSVTVGGVAIHYNVAIEKDYAPWLDLDNHLHTLRTDDHNNRKENALKLLGISS